MANSQMRFLLVIVSCLMAPVASALKGATLLRTELELPSRMLQDTQVPPPMLPKGTQAPNVGVDGTTKKADKETKTKEKKCVKGPKDDVPPPPALPPASAPSMPLPNDEEPFCVQGAATLEECQSAQDGKTPQEDQSIFGDVQVDISYDSTPGNNGTTITATDVLNKVEAIFQTDTTFDFLGCEAYDSVSSFPGNDGWGRRSLQTTGSEMPHTLGHNASTIEEIRVTGVDFTKVQASENACQSSFPDMSCDTIETEVQIYYESSSNEKLSLTESKHLLELLVSTIKSQAAEGGFLQVGTIESVESLSAVGSENGATSNSSVCRKWGWEILRLEGMVLVSLMLLFPVTIA